MGQSLRVIIVEDSEIDAELVLHELKAGGFELDSIRVDRPAAFEQALYERDWDLIICDYIMPHFSEPAAMDLLKQSKKDIPFIVISGKIGEETAVNAMKSGANDYVMKDNLARLVPAIHRELQEARERSARRQVEQELEHFIASLTHDLRTPIMAELRILELITAGSFGPLPPQLRDVLEELVQSNQFMQHMVNNILYAYKYKQGKIRLENKSTDLSDFLSRYVSSKAVQSLLNARELHLTVEPSAPIPNVCMDSHEIHRVLDNILKNAVDHSPQGANIDIRIQPDHDFVRVGVHDDGPGVDPGIEPYLFTPYTTTTAKKYHQVGLGLGLYLSKRIIEAHKGHIGYESKPGGGCLFYFDLAVANA